MLTPPSIAYEDNHLLVLCKTPGWLVQEDRTRDHTLTDWGRAYIKHNYNKPGDVFLHPAHRLDRPVSGLVVFCRTSKALERMNKLFHDDDVEKEYLAIVSGAPENTKGTLTHWLKKDGRRNVTKAYDKAVNGAKKATLSYELLAGIGGKSLLHVKPKTGRPHQIRVQLSRMESPIQGDLRYGDTKPNADKSISLHAFRLSFVHPVKKEPLQLTCAPKGNQWSQFEAFVNELVG